MSADHAVAIYCKFGSGQLKPAGSGTEIRPGVILSARHVLYKDGERADEVQVGWWENNGTDLRQCAAEPEFWEDQTRDVALVQTGRPEDIKDPAFQLSVHKIQRAIDLSGYGFPAISDADGRPHPELLLAKCGATLPDGRSLANAPSFEPSATWKKDKSPAELDRALSGASGTGLFDGSCLKGVLIGRRPKTNSYDVCCLGALWEECNAFRAKLNEWSPESPLEPLLNESLESLPAPIHEELRPLCRPGCCRTLDAVLQKILNLLERGQADKDAQILNKLARTLFAHALTRIALPPRNSVSQGDCGLVVPTMQLSGAEGFMAAMEERPSEHRPTGTKDPPGTRNLSAPPSASFSKENPDRFDELEGKTGLDLRNFPDALGRRLNHELESPASVDDVEWRRKLILRILKRKHAMNRFYLSYDKSSTNLDQVIDSVAQDYEGHVAVLKLDGGSDLAVDLMDAQITLADILTFVPETPHR